MNFKQCFDSYVVKLPDMTSSEENIRAAITDQFEICKKAELVLQDSETLDFVTEAGLKLNLNLDVQDHVQRTYNLEESPVVLVLMGAAGLGKSTLLNHIVQFCTETFQLPQKFKMGNTGGHTTRNSQILSRPLYYKGQQYVLMDLQGLGGTEVQDIENLLMQKNLISALLTAASVPYILVSNVESSLRFVRELITDIANLQQKFGFYTERIHLLFHDKNAAGEENCDNIHFKQLVIELNNQHFGGREVIKIRNKPNFSSASASLKQEFLRTLLDDSAYPKKKASLAPETIQDILAKIQLITTHDSMNFDDLLLSPEEIYQNNQFIAQKIEEIRQIQRRTIIPPDSCQTTPTLIIPSLLTRFNENYYGEYAMKLEKELAANQIFRKHCKARLDLQLNLIRAEVLEIENCNRIICVVGPDQMKKNLKLLVRYFYKTTFSNFGFLPKVDLLIKKLETIQHHFPYSKNQIDYLLQTVRKYRGKYKLRSNLLIGGQVIFTLATFGTMGAVGSGVKLGSALLLSEETVIASLFGLTSAAVVNVGRLGFTPMIMTEKAVELVWVNSNWGNGEVNNQVFKAIQAEEKMEHLHPDAPAPVLLFIGPKSTLFSTFANSFVLHIAPFTPADFQAFSPTKYTQILPFNYVHRVEDTDKGGHTFKEKTTRSYLICLCMESPESEHYQAMLKLAEMLIPAASVACLLVDESAKYVGPLLTALFPPSLDPNTPEKTKIKTRILMVIPDTRVNIAKHGKVLSEYQANFGVMQIHDFTPDNIRAATKDIQTELNEAKVQPYIKFREKIIPLVVKERAVALMSPEASWIHWREKGGISKEAKRTIEATDREKEAQVLLLIGSKAAPIAEYANSFIHQIAPFTTDSFSPSEYTQILPFDYVNPGEEYTPTCGLLICLHMENYDSTNYAAMNKIAEALILIASVTYIIEKGPAQSLFASLPQSIQTRVKTHRESGVKPTGVIYGLRPEDGLTMEQAIFDIKSSFDRANGIKYSIITEQINRLSQALK